MPRLVKLYIKNVMIGFAIAAAFVAMLLVFDVMGLRGLMLRSGDGLLALFVLWFMNGIVFASVQFAWAVMSLAQKKDKGPRGGTPARLELQPLRVRAEAPSRQARQLRIRR